MHWWKCVWYTLDQTSSSWWKHCGKGQIQGPSKLSNRRQRLQEIFWFYNINLSHKVQMRLIPQISAYYWYRYWSCLRLIIWFLGTGKWFFVLENHFLVPWKQTIRNFEMPTCVDICNAMAEVGAICSIRWINWNKIHKTKNKTQNSIVIFGIFHKKWYCYFGFFWNNLTKIRLLFIKNSTF